MVELLGIYASQNFDIYAKYARNKPKFQPAVSSVIIQENYPLSSPSGSTIVGSDSLVH